MSTIQWYPGHMTKAKRNMEADLRLVDMVFEVLDARVPRSSENPDIRKITKGKKRLVLLNKADLADPAATKSWIDSFRDGNTIAVALDSRSRDGLSVVRNAVEILDRERKEKEKSRGLLGSRPVKAMVLGIPNIGKSTLINSLCGKVSAKTGNKPGVTKGNQWVSAGNRLLLLDTPGVLWPKFDDKMTGYHLAATGAISDTILDIEDVAMVLSGELLLAYPECLLTRYGFTTDELQNTMETCAPDIPGLNREALAVLSLIAEKRHCIRRGSELDYEKASRLLLDDFRNGKLGRISLEKPDR